MHGRRPFDCFQKHRASCGLTHRSTRPLPVRVNVRSFRPAAAAPVNSIRYVALWEDLGPDFTQECRSTDGGENSGHGPTPGCEAFWRGEIRGWVGQIQPLPQDMWGLSRKSAKNPFSFSNRDGGICGEPPSRPVLPGLGHSCHPQPSPPDTPWNTTPSAIPGSPAA